MTCGWAGFYSSALPRRQDGNISASSVERLFNQKDQPLKTSQDPSRMSLFPKIQRQETRGWELALCGNCIVRKGKSSVDPQCLASLRSARVAVRRRPSWHSRLRHKSQHGQCPKWRPRTSPCLQHNFLDVLKTSSQFCQQQHSHYI